MRGRPPKPLALKIAEGQRLSQSSSGINFDAPSPPPGPLDPPAELSVAEGVVWRHITANQAPGVLRPLDLLTLRQYVWFLTQVLAAQAELRDWVLAKKKWGETAFLRRARNGELIRHPLYGLIQDLSGHVLKLETVLGFSPVARERIHASAQQELFGEMGKSETGWADLDASPVAGEKPQ